MLPRLLEPPDLPDEPLPTLAWLLGHARAGLRLTARHYIAPALVGEAAELFGWGPAGATPEQAARRHQELDVYPLHTLRGLAQHEMGAVRRSGVCPGPDPDRAADGRRRRGALAHRHGRPHRPRRRP